jgi:LacI family transcriptional regulator
MLRAIRPAPPTSGPVSLIKGRLTTLLDVAKRAGVSQAAVSVVLRGKEGKIAVSAEVRERILRAANELDYRPSRSARIMRSGRTHAIGFVSRSYSAVTGRVGNHGMYPFLVGLNQRLANEDFHTVMVELGELETKSEKNLPTALRERFFDGLVMHIGLAPEPLALLRSCGLPSVFFDSGVFEAERCIDRDEVKVARAAVEHLVGLGHRRIGLFHLGRHWFYYQNMREVLDHHSYIARIEGFESALKEQGLEPIHVVNDPNPEVLARSLQQEKLSALVIGGGDRVPGPIAQALAIAGLRVPRDLSIASLDVEARAVALEFEMGGVLFDRFSAGCLAAEQILQAVNDPRAVLPSVVLPVELRLGNTIAPPTKG